MTPKRVTSTKLFCLLLIFMIYQPLAVHGVICESFTTEDQCQGLMTSSGECFWREAAQQCFTNTTKRVPPGVVAITTVGHGAEGEMNPTTFNTPNRE